MNETHLMLALSLQTALFLVFQQFLFLCQKPNMHPVVRTEEMVL